MTANAPQRGVGTEQYSLAKILDLWAATALPLAFMGWIVFPALTPDWGVDPMGVGYARMGTITVALIWEFVLALIIVYHEEGDLRWGTIGRRLRLNTPRVPKTGEPRRKLWWWLLPLCHPPFCRGPFHSWNVG